MRHDPALRDAIPPLVRTVPGDLRRPESYEPALHGIHTVVHLAAATGRQTPADFFAVNVDGTRALLERCRRAGVRRFVYASSVAARFKDKTGYAYAQSKAHAERLVEDSGLEYAIVRPTIVLGRRSPAWQAFARMAAGPAAIVPGRGTVMVQPVYVEDVASCLTALIDAPNLPAEPLEIGGPDSMTIGSLVAKIRQRYGKPPGPTIHLPVRTLKTILRGVEPFLFPILPINAGQLSAFLNDTTARPDPWLETFMRTRTSLDAMLQILTADG